jgi:hypothetical protein
MVVFRIFLSGKKGIKRAKKEFGPLFAKRRSSLFSFIISLYNGCTIEHEQKTGRRSGAY